VFTPLSLRVASTDRPFTPDPSFNVPPETSSVKPPTIGGGESVLPAARGKREDGKRSAVVNAAEMRLRLSFIKTS
jgi:hypothetical protein